MNRCLSIKDAARRVCVEPRQIREAIDKGELKPDDGCFGSKIPIAQLVEWADNSPPEEPAPLSIEEQVTALDERVAALESAKP